ncbi:hypothetical protein C2S53_020449 [Perilla frutescens var. hirtella]|uniref:AP2/ERF domain-containing protein n=1 Tax=Perilla frutescens var. hirtella TaxID=608512 RepID=A0AAD4JGC2_PERFH|nr:hypothetical protein C2S53_020449 [Perilla frutescens var. hirtella]
MDLVCLEHSCSSSSPLQTATSPEKLTPAAAKHKKRAGRKIFNETRHPVYRGVRRKNGGKWVCEVREPNKKSRIWLGTFPTPETAAVAHDVAALALRGDKAPVNFPDSVARLPRPHSSSHQDIQRAASKAAREFSPVQFSPTLDVSKPDPDPFMVGFVDEEAVFNMPALLDSMAEGMLLTPLAMKKGFNWSQYEVEDEGTELSLWGNLIN